MVARSRQAAFFQSTSRVVVTSRFEGANLVHEVESGTAFSVMIDIADGVVFFLVTARHVVEGANDGSVFFLRAEPTEEGEVTYEFNRRTGFRDLWFFHPRPDIDVAIAPLMLGTPMIDELTERATQIKGFRISRDESLLPETEEALWPILPDLDYIEDVLFLGYPVGLYDHVHGLPLLRRAVTATPIFVDYEGRPEFLVDGAVWEGSSGSPVVILDRRIVIKNRVFRGDPNYDEIREIERFVFLGMLTDRLRHRNAPEHVNIGLGAVVKAVAVFEAIDAWLALPRITA
jgi:hypothetical protein